MKQSHIEVTERIIEVSRPTRTAYLQRVDEIANRQRGADRLGCANVAHAFAAMPSNDKLRIVAEKAPNIGIVTAYNDMLSAHQPYANYPDIIKDEAHKYGATAQVAGGVPAMCDGITQGEPGMELSLFSRDTIAMSTAISLSHDVFDAALLLGVCDKIVPGLLIGALHFGHLPCVFVPAGPMSTGIDNTTKSKVREKYAQGLVGREELLASESAAYHGAGTCTFYGTANSNQMLMEAMGLHVPGSAFIHPHDGMREMMTREAVKMVLHNTKRDHFTPIGKLVDEHVIVNAMVALLATGGSTNHLIHWVAIARAAGIIIDWTDFYHLAKTTPLLASVYPNGKADVNEFQSAGGPAFVIRELIDAGYMYPDVFTVAYGGLREYGKLPAQEDNKLVWKDLPKESSDETIVRTAEHPFNESGGLRLLKGNLGRSVIKISAVPEDRHIIEAPAIVFDAQEELLEAFDRGELERDFVAVVRFQGPKANGMPELHKLTPPLAVLQNKGFMVAIVTDGRMSGASGKIPAAIHLSPEASAGGALAKVRTGDIIRLNAKVGMVNVLVDEDVWAEREVEELSDSKRQHNAHGIGRELFGGMRRNVLSAEEGAVTWL
ncbi:6-phosphogluconate dehydratase [Methylophilaceae bacterium 11]|jgi:phosphogluconate dehydratase|uniref:phosphogluconate dehydratase n=1 Tax=unclassified Methylotenera TaxID=2643294 RepID=UPI00037337F0|nr:MULTISPECIES: phosphogluconate dehydratase [unclassified Methylotenera]EUJ11092.1 6-phosphogluconate dehydratase [Methylophilaceae bacterium 11]